MTKEEFSNKWGVLSTSTFRPRFESDLNSVIAQAIAEHERNKDHTLDEFIDEVNRMRELFCVGKYTKSDEIKEKLADNMDDIQCLAFRELPEPYKPEQP